MRLKKPNNGEKFKGKFRRIVPVVMLTTALGSLPATYYVGQQEGYEKGQQEGYEKGQQEGYEKGQQEGYDSGYSDGQRYGVDQTIRYSDNNVTDGMNYGIQRKYDDARDYFINLYENKDTMNAQEFENNAHVLIQSIKMLFRNKADIYADDEEKNEDSLEFTPNKITYGIGGGQRLTFCEFSNSNSLQRFSARISRLVDALNGKRIEDVYYELGGIELDIPMRFLKSVEITYLQNGNIAVKANPYFDEREYKKENGAEQVYQPTVQAAHKSYEASKFIRRANKTVKAILNEANNLNNEITKT